MKNHYNYPESHAPAPIIREHSRELDLQLIRSILQKRHEVLVKLR
jgi:hypothetical protein